MKKIAPIIASAILLIAVLLIASVSALDECQSLVDPNEKCAIITPVIDCNTYDLYNPTYNLTIDDGAMTQIGSTGTYNITFNQTTQGIWTYILCSDHTLALTVGDTIGISYYYIYAFLFIITIVLFVLGHKTEDLTFTMIAGFIPVVMAILLYRQGFPNFTNQFVLNAIAIILLCFGLYIIIRSAIEYSKGLN